MKTIFMLQVLCVVCSSSFAQLSRDTTVAQQQILSVIHQQIEGWNNGNIEVFMQGYANTDLLRFASGGTVTYGWKNMLDRYKKSYSTKDKMGTLSFSDITVDIISSDAAIVFGTWKLNRDKDIPWGLFTLLFKNKNGVWRIVHDHTSSGN